MNRSEKIQIDNNKISIWIADDNLRLCKQLCNLLIENNFNKISTFNTCEAVIETSQQKKHPDILILDISFPNGKMSGFDLLKQHSVLLPTTKIITMTLWNEEEYLRPLFQHGAVGFIDKRKLSDDLIKAIFIVINGGIFACPVSFSEILMRTNIADLIFRRYKLTPKEKTILSDLIDGLQIKVIAEKQSITINTVNYHIKNLHKKFYVQSTHQLIIKALQ
jgi:DNA-binding NarL/FixJ family response regulator